MENVALKSEYQTIAEIVERIIQSRQMTADDQSLINETARHNISNDDMLAIKHLTDLVQCGMVAVV